MHKVERSDCKQDAVTHPRQERAITPYRSEACRSLNKERRVVLRGLSVAAHDEWQTAYPLQFMEAGSNG